MTYRLTFGSSCKNGSGVNYRPTTLNHLQVLFSPKWRVMFSCLIITCFNDAVSTEGFGSKAYLRIRLERLRKVMKFVSHDSLSPTEILTLYCCSASLVRGSLWIESGMEGNSCGLLLFRVHLECMSKTTKNVLHGSRDSSVGIVTRLQAGRPRDRSSVHGSGKRFFSSPQRPDWLWGPSSLLYNG
jgi:hypothetical protein